MLTTIQEPMSTPAFLANIRERGWVHFKQNLEPSFVTGLNEGMTAAYTTCKNVQVKNGVDVNTDGTVHHLLGQEPVFLDFIRRLELHDYIKAFFNAPISSIHLAASSICPTKHPMCAISIATSAPFTIFP